MRSYEAARSLFSFLGFISWAVIVIGVLAALAGAGSVSTYAGGAASLVATLPGLAIAVAGFLLLAFVQMGRATVDSAEYGQQMLKIARDQLVISQQALKLSGEPVNSFSTLKNGSEDSSGKSGFAQAKKTPPDKANKIVDEEIKYGGQTILRQGKTYYVGADRFHKLLTAEKHIDLLNNVKTEDAAAKVKLLKKEITEENGKFFYSGIEFSSKTKAETYIKTFATPHTATRKKSV